MSIDRGQPLLAEQDSSDMKPATTAEHVSSVPTVSPPGTAQSQRGMLTADAVRGAPSAPPSPISSDSYEKFESRLTSLEHSRTTQRAALAVLMALGVGGMLTGLMSNSWGDLMTRLEASERASRLAADAIEISAKSAAATFRRDLFRILEEVSRSSRDRELEIRIHETKERLAGMTALKQSISPDTAKRIDHLERLFALTEDYAKAVRPSQNHWDSNHVAFVRETIKKWSSIDSGALRKYDPQFAEAFEPYQHNAIGTMELQLEREDPERDGQSDYATARKHFRAALERNPRLAKAHTNLGVIAMYEWGSSSKISIDRLLEARRHFAKAKDYTGSSSLLSTLYNNLADVSLNIANWHLSKGDRENGLKALREAKMNVRRSLAQIDPQAIGYVTYAEAECVELKSSLGSLSTARRREIADNAMSRLQLAVDLGYERLRGQSIDRLRTRFPLLDACSAAEPGFMQSVAALD